MSITYTTILIIAFLLPGFYFIKGVQKLIHIYVNNSITSWKAPDFISYVFSASIIFNSLGLVYFLYLVGAFEKQENYLIVFELLFKPNFQVGIGSLVLVLLHTFLASCTAYLAGVIIGDLFLERKSPPSSFVKHRWVLTLLKNLKYAGRGVEVTVYTTEFLDSGQGDRIVYNGMLDDFFLSSRGEVKYITIKNAKKSDTTSLDYVNSEEYKGSDDDAWAPVVNKSFDDFLYLCGTKIFNLACYPKIAKVKSSLMSIFKDYFYLWLLLIFLVYASLPAADFVTKVYENSHKEEKNVEGKKLVSMEEESSEVDNVDTLLLVNDIERDLMTNGTYINVRSSPSKFAKIITNIHSKDTKVKALKKIPENDNWYKIKFQDGSTGYIFSDLLSEKK